MNFPTLSGNWVDLIIITLLLFYVWDGWGKGFIRGTIDVIGFLLSLVIALRFYSFAAGILISNFSLSRGVANALGFFAMAVLSESLLYWASTYLEQYIDPKLSKSRANMVLGVLPAILSSLVLTAFILTAFVTLPLRPDIKQDIVKSRIGGFLTRQTLGLERSISAIFGDAIQETLTFLTIKPEGTETVDLHFTATEYSIDAESEQTMYALINKERQANGLNALSFNTPLTEVARNHCQDMFAKGYFSHISPEGLSPFDRMEQAGIEYRAAAENLAFAPTVEIAHNGLMNSPGHRANILSAEFGKIGIGVINGGMYGRMFCQEFSN